MRTAFIQQLIREARQNSKIFLLVGDLGYNVVDSFSSEFPSRYLNVGIAEQNMVGVAVGLAMEGFIPFIYSIANFPTMRCMEQIRNDVCYHDFNINIVSIGGGFSYGSLGASHQATEDIGMMRIIPNMTVCAPGDPTEAKWITHLAVESAHPFYIRLDKAGEAIAHSDQDFSKMKTGDILKVKEGTSIAVLSTGGMLKYSYDFISNNNIYCALYSFPFIKPVNKIQLKQIFEKFKMIITIEEHQSSGGLGSVVLEYLNDFIENDEIQNIPKIRRIAIPDKFYSISGSQNFLRENAGLILKKEFFNNG
ncbi:MAG TPA: transketolase C-terminal domain-containing protein [Bacteroidales bacterium]|jgi:transketolase|nr:transketolase C-terminal domain-containing protein [Bacteroidales bacterium]